MYFLYTYSEGSGACLDPVPTFPSTATIEDWRGELDFSLCMNEGNPNSVCLNGSLGDSTAIKNIHNNLNKKKTIYSTQS
jgi:hypothetical protein